MSMLQKVVLTMLCPIQYRSMSLSSKVQLLFLCFDFLIEASSLQFHYYPAFKGDDKGNFTYQGSSNLVFGALQITLDSSSPNFENKSGRVLYKDTFKLWKDHGSVVASFNTSFELIIQPQTRPGGEGLAFILAANPELPSNSDGQWLGIVNQETNGSSANQIIAIEFDTRKSYPEDIDDNHVGVDINTIDSLVQIPLGSSGVNLSSGLPVLASLQYNGESRIMAINFSLHSNKSKDHWNPLIVLPINLSEFLPEDIYIGFSGSTGYLTQLNCINSWNFTGEDIVRRNGVLVLWQLLLAILLPTFIILGGFCCYLFHRRKRMASMKGNSGSFNVEAMLEDSTDMPHKFRFRELKSATANFHPTNKLGQGGFGSVYKGFLKDSKREVAIKRLFKDSHQGEKEFLAEVMTISRMRHKNLVKLLGWCCERDELILVYEYLPNGSLDKHLFCSADSKLDGSNTALSWDRRYKIICGVASALSYLHDGSEKRVLHRDVKASNVMIDSEYNARLGDFGLARMIQNEEKTHHSTKAIAGTPGYIAPECFHTARATVEIDVYGFGVFIMEVACGRRPTWDLQESSLVDWVWDLYGRAKIIDCVDPRLHGEFKNEEMKQVLELGLVCCHPNPNERPTMGVAVQVLRGQAAAPVPPIERPNFVWPVRGSSVLIGASDGGGRLSQFTDLSGR